MTAPRNILFIMFDQLRWDYLSCAGHPHLKTPNMDALAKEGVRFTRAYVQSPVCGSSRMSTYTGRYVHSHGATWNRVPLKVGEQTMGDHLRRAGMDCVLVGKTHMQADTEGMARLGIPADSIIGVRTAECGFDPFDRDDGLYPQETEKQADVFDDRYNQWLRAQGYTGGNPWHDHANAGRDDDGGIASGWFMKNSGHAAHIKEEHSETPYMTGRAIEFLEQAGTTPWCLHLSYIKPHWPYIVPAPYHDMYGPEHVIPANRAQSELSDMHPVYAEMVNSRIGKVFSRDEVRETVIPAYMGLIKQCDDQLGRLFNYLKQAKFWDDTLIVLTSDHGDNLGDHWLGEKDLFHDCSVKVPLIIRDPSPAADQTRGTTNDHLVEAIDLAPTFLDYAGGDPVPHILEGRSLRPFIQSEPPAKWRDYVISEYDYGANPVFADLAAKMDDPRQFMIANKRWKLVHAEGLRPMLFDLQEDPKELNDLGNSPEHADIRQTLFDALNAWARRNSQRTTIGGMEMRRHHKNAEAQGVLIGIWDEEDLPDGISNPYPPDGGT